MSWQSPQGMEDYLKSTKLCDCENEKLKGKAKEIIKGADTPKEAALKIFHFTREEILEVVKKAVFFNTYYPFWDDLDIVERRFKK